MVTGMKFFNRDISWLSFNERVLAEAGKSHVPLKERFRFLGIYSSNLDEFYRVRIPAYNKRKSDADDGIPDQIRTIINNHQNIYGDIVRTQLIPAMLESGYTLLYNVAIPGDLNDQITLYFLQRVAGYLEVVSLDANSGFFPLNNYLYKAILTSVDEQISAWIINIPSDHLPRFKTFKFGTDTYILFLDDIIDHCLKLLFRNEIIVTSCNVKLTRDASLKLIENDQEDAADVLEGELSKRERGKATRFLYDPTMPKLLIDRLREHFDLKKSALVAGGRYHNLKDFGEIPLNGAPYEYPVFRPLDLMNADLVRPLFESILDRDRLVHTPYHSYECVIRFFNEASIDPAVSEIYITLYRIAADSRIGHALISAAKNGKDVYVIVELKARFDEANNIKWAKTMKAAGIRIIYSENDLKVHAKVALIKRKGELPMIGLLATGNFNENTARFYTDHILLTAHQPMLAELSDLFQVMVQEKKIKQAAKLPFRYLLVAQFNLYERFIWLINREIAYAREGLDAGIVIKLNNLEEETLIVKLYEASNAGVNIRLLVRGICRLVPGVGGQSEKITVHRIVDRFLEHGRIFIFTNNGDQSVYLGSSDWMNRNIYHRIEVCFPVLDNGLKKEMQDLVQLQLQDNVQALVLDENLAYSQVNNGLPPMGSQTGIYNYLKDKNETQEIQGVQSVIERDVDD